MTKLEKTLWITARIGAVAIALTVTACIVVTAHQNANRDSVPVISGEDIDEEIVKPVPASARKQAYLRSSKSLADPITVALPKPVSPQRGKSPVRKFMFSSKSVAPIHGGLLSSGSTDEKERKKVAAFLSTSKSLVIRPSDLRTIKPDPKQKPAPAKQTTKIR